VSLWKRGGVWWNYFYLDGVRNQASTGTGNRRQAELIANKQRLDANARRFQIVDADPNVKFGEIAAKFIANATVTKHHLYHLKILLPYFADLPAIRLTKAQIEEFRRYRQRGNPNIKDSSVNRDLSVLRRVLYWSVEESLLLANPLARMRMVRERRTRRQVLSVEEEDKILAVAQPHLRRIITAALDTGMRRGEILGQRWEHIDFSRRLLFVTRSKTPEGESREIPLTERLLGVLSENRQSEGFVFTLRGEPISWIRKGWLGALKHAKVRHCRFHDLRHTFNSRLMEAGVIQDVRMALMGHSGGSRINSIYTHVELPGKRQAIARLEEWVKQQRQDKKGETDNAST
jgi:integrase